MSRKRLPSYALHKATGQARVRIGGKDTYLGLYGSPESRERYGKLVDEFLRSSSQQPSGLTVGQLSLAYMEHVKKYYRKNGEPTSEVELVRHALRSLNRDFSKTPADKFTPKMLKSFRQKLIDEGRVRNSINRDVGRIRRMFQWAVAEEVLPATVLVTLQAVGGLQAGRSEAVESEPVKPVSDADIDAVLPHVAKPIRAMIELQRFTGMRPGEVLILCPGDITMRTDGMWTYRPKFHKTQHLGKDRSVILGKRAYDILRPWLDRDEDAYCFQPVESDRSKNRIGKAGKPYRRDSYALAIRRACVKVGIPPWSPNQLRHTYATLVREHFGLEAAQVVLGHSRADVTQVYAERNLKLAAKVQAKIG